MLSIIRTYRFADSSANTHKVTLAKIGRYYQVRLDSKLVERAVTPKRAKEQFEATVKGLEQLKAIAEEGDSDA